MLRLDEYKMAAEDYYLQDRLRKRLYYGCKFPEECSSLPLTELTVEFLQEAAPRELGKVDEYFASSVTRDTCMSPCSMMLGLLYIDRLKHKNPEYLKTISSSELFLISMMMATKYLEDEGVDEEVFNDEWAESGGMDTEDINDMEREFLSAIDWNLFVKRSDFFNHMASIERRIALTEGLKRGWFTYSDLCVLMDNQKLSDLLLESGRNLNDVVLASSLTYLAGFLTILGSTLLITTASTGLATLATMLPHHQEALLSASVDLEMLLLQQGIPTTSRINNSWADMVDEKFSGSNNLLSELLNAPDGSFVADMSSAKSDEVIDNTTTTDNKTHDEDSEEPMQKNSLRTVLSRFWTVLMLRDTLVNILPDDEGQGHILSCKTCSTCSCTKMKKRNMDVKCQKNKYAPTPPNSAQNQPKQESRLQTGNRGNDVKKNASIYDGLWFGGGDESVGDNDGISGETGSCRDCRSISDTGRIILPFTDVIRGFTTSVYQILVT